MRPLCILVTGEPVAPVLASRGTFADLIQHGGRAFPGSFRVVDVRSAEPPPLAELAGIIVTGSASSVTERAPWMLATERYLAQAVDRGPPLLGICFGHQLLGQALGGRVEKNPLGREIGTVTADVVEDDPLLSERRPFTVNTTHMDSVTELPRGVRVLARTALEPHAALRFGERAWGVQFHPEFDAGVVRGYINARADIIAAEGSDPARLHDAAEDAEPGAEVLARFVMLVTEAEKAR
ncbi:MAG TPA: glutamine amidotransferase [Polyangiaceae bacterium]|nr:glutamine amidotransferase [Polyangiaceae bacterium]